MINTNVGDSDTYTLVVTDVYGVADTANFVTREQQLPLTPDPLHRGRELAFLVFQFVRLVTDHEVQQICVQAVRVVSERVVAGNEDAFVPVPIEGLEHRLHGFTPGIGRRTVSRI